MNAMSPQERRAYVARLAGDAERRRALDLPPSSGDLLTDLAAVQDRAGEIELLWGKLDQLARSARAELGAWPSDDAVSEVLHLEAGASEAWAARQAAVRARDRLQALFDGRTPATDAAEEKRFNAMGARLRHELWEREPDVGRR